MATTKAKKKTENTRKNDGKKSKKEARSAAAKATKPAIANGHGADDARDRRSTQSAPVKDKRQLVQERKILRSQSRWLQKALFALAKAEDDQEKLAEIRGEKHEPMAITVKGNTYELGAVTDSLRDSVMARLESLRVTLRNEHALLG
jgi:hypothetical protein